MAADEDDTLYVEARLLRLEFFVGLHNLLLLDFEELVESKELGEELVVSVPDHFEAFLSLGIDVFFDLVVFLLCDE